MHTVRNWARTYASTPRVLSYIDTVEDVAASLEAARSSGAHVRVIGAAQSPSDIAMSNEHLLAIRGLNRVREIDRDACQVVAEAGITLGALSAALSLHGLALPNLGSIARQTLGGAAATGTHGTGVHHGSTPTWIQQFEMCTVDGTVLSASAQENADLFAGARLSLGTLGVQTAFCLKVTDAFDLRVEEGPVSLESAMQPGWHNAADHARVWYLPYVDHAWGWRAFRIPRNPKRTKLAGQPLPPSDAPAEAPRLRGLRQWIRDRALGYYGFEAGLWLAAFVPSLLPTVNRAYSSLFLTQPRRSTGDSASQFTFDCLFHQRVSEWAVPLADAREAVLGVRDMAERALGGTGLHAHLPIEVRYTAGDDLWLSPTYGGPRCWVGVVSYIPFGREVAWRPWFAAFEEHMLRFNGRPHWAKEFNAGPETLSRLYSRWADFQRLRTTFDPDKRLRNTYTDRVFG